EVMLHHPGVVVAQPIGQLDLRQCVLIEPVLAVRLPGPWQLQLVEDAEFHLVPPAAPSRRIMRPGILCAATAATEPRMGPARLRDHPTTWRRFAVAIRAHSERYLADKLSRGHGSDGGVPVNAFVARPQDSHRPGGLRRRRHFAACAGERTEARQ